MQAAACAELQTTSAAPGATISGPSLLALPNLGRDANAFVTLQPGVTPGGEMAGKANDQNYFSIDGGNVSSDHVRMRRWGETWSKPMCCNLRLEDKRQ